MSVNPGTEKRMHAMCHFGFDFAPQHRINGEKKFLGEQRDQQNRTGSPEINYTQEVNLSPSRMSRTHNRGKSSLFNKVCSENWECTCKD